MDGKEDFGNMRKSVQEAHKRHLIRHYLVDTVTLSEPFPDGTWSAPVTVKASVQQPRPDRSSPDRQEASERETRNTAVYVPGDTAAGPGWRVVWNDGVSDHTYVVEACATERTNRAMIRLDVSRAQTAVIPVNLSFRRRSAGAWIDIGTFPAALTVSAIITASRTGVVGGIVDAASAAGATTTGIFTGDSALLVLDVGDWFNWQNVPGRITAMDRDDLDHIECSFEMEAWVP